MKERGLGSRHRDEEPPKAGEVQQEHSDTVNENLPAQFPGFSPRTAPGTMRRLTGRTSVEAVRRAVRGRRQITLTC